MSVDVAETAALAPLFEPFVLKRLALPNRFVMAPMTRKRSSGGVPGDEVAAYYRRRAEGSVGLIVTEGTLIEHPAAGDHDDVPRFFGDRALDGWRRVVEAVHAAGGRIVPQLWHVGMLRPSPSGDTEAASVGPSPLTRAGRTLVHPLSEPEIAKIVAAFAQGAVDAQRLGFDGVELHGAHGYLIDQFFWEMTNRRTDRYAGDIGARTELASEIVRACRRGICADFPLILRFSQWKLQDYGARLARTPKELELFLRPLVDAGTDMFDCSTREFWRAEFEGDELNLAGWTKKLTGCPVITVGAVWQCDPFLGGRAAQGASSEVRLRQAARMVADSQVDLVALGRPLLADPGWVEKIRHGQTELIQLYRPSLLDALI